MGAYTGMSSNKSASYHTRIILTKTLIYIVCIILVLIAVLPFIIMFMSATKDRVEITKASLDWAPEIKNKLLISLLPSNALKGNYEALFKSQSLNLNFAEGFKSSIIIALGSTLLSVYFSALTAYGFVVYRFRGSKVLYSFVLAIMMVPTQVSAIGFVEMMYEWELKNSFIPLILPAIAAPGTVFFLRQYMSSALSIELVEAGRIDGCNEFRIFNRLVLPILKPGMATMAIFAMVSSWNNFYLPTLLIIDRDKYTVPMLVNLLNGNKYQTEYGAMYLGLSISALPLIAFYLIFSKYIIAGVALGGVKE